MTYTVIPSDRKTIALQIRPNGEILVRCPRKMSSAAIKNFVESKADWIQKHLARLSPQDTVTLTPEKLHILREQTRQLVTLRAAYFAPLIGVTYEKIAVRTQRTRWGSCSSKGNLNFNCLLAQVPPEVLDYVVVHELCHRKEMNHSNRFWMEVSRILPDYPQRKKWLKDHGHRLMAQLG